ncbi:MAG: ABC transporter substrate-binding protein [Streptosporangiaceae bacterium]|nr:ABC transporter substrate-binding protein [Streptosporangiaceae bacterium]MBV9858206.1 ABC transporter substrate-binding protein [Streptosporangiaceae bacterium]
MTKSIHLTLAAVGVLAVAACASGSGGNGGGSSSGPVGVVQIAAYSGDQAFEAQFSASIDYPALYAVNHGGGVLGRQVSLIQVDTRSDPADALAAMGKTLATTGNVAAVLGPDSTSAATLVPLLNTRHLPMMIAAGEAAYDRSSYAYLWRDVPPDPANGEAIALWAKRQGYTSVATVFGTDTGSQGDLPGVLTGVKAVGVRLADQENLTPDQPSYRSSVERLLAAKPQAVITESDGPTAATFFGELRQLGSLLPIIGTSGTPSDSYFSPLRGAIGDAAFGTYFRAVVVGNPVSNPAVAAFNADVLAVQGKLSKPVSQWENNSFSESGYDAMITLALAMDAAHSTDGTAYNNDIMAVTAPAAGKEIVYTYAAGRAALAAGHKIQYIGASGPLLFDKYHNSFGSQAVEKFPANAPAVVVGTITQAQVQALNG